MNYKEVKIMKIIHSRIFGLLLVRSKFLEIAIFYKKDLGVCIKLFSKIYLEFSIL